MTDSAPRKRPGSASPAAFLVARDPRALAVGLVALALLLAGNLARVLWLNGGTFTYTLDDPYIHLALADHIRAGHYGINAGEPSAPSSSILWPFLLALVGGAAQAWLPLAINATCAVLAVVAFAAFLAEIPGIGRLAPGWTRAGWLLLLVLATNLVGLVAMGMEHGLQVWLTALAALGLARTARGARPGWLVPVLVLGPLVRYENMSVTVPALAYVFWRGGRGAAVVGGVVLLALLGAFSAFLKSIGMAVLPTSILAKVGALEHPAWYATLLDNVKSVPGLLLVVLAGGLAWLAWRLRVRSGTGTGTGPVRGLLAVGVATLGLHLLVGHHGWFNRYEIYVVAFGLLLGLYGLGAWVSLAPALPDRTGIEAKTEAGTDAAIAVRRNRAAAVAWAVLALTAAFYARALPRQALAANDIYEQQYQMHRFLAAHPLGPVAVNDIGLVAYHNPDYVLDIAGLASRPALECQAGACGPQHVWLDRLARAHGVRLAMLYRKYYPDVPAGWRPLGELTLDRAPVTAGDNRVSFYALDDQALQQARAALAAFQPSLPPGAAFVPAEAGAATPSPTPPTSTPAPHG